MKVSFFGTTTLLFDDGRDQLLFDAHMTRPSLPTYLFGSRGSDTAIVSEMLQKHPMDRLRAIFISHTHYDHVMDLPMIAEQTGAAVYGSRSALNVARGGGIGEDRLFEFAAEQTYTFGGFSVKVLRSLHSKPNFFSNDLGQEIEKPLPQPARLRNYKEGGSYDFLVTAGDKRYLIRPSFNYLEGQLDGYEADVLFLGVAGLAKADEATEKRFFAETVEKVKPKTVVPIHWDNFFSPLYKPVKRMPWFVEDTGQVFFKLAKRCEALGVNCLVQLPRTSVEL